MTTPSQSKPQPQQTGAGAGCAMAAVLVAVALMTGLVSACMCGGVILYFYAARVQPALAQAGIPAPDISLPEPQIDWNDWMVQRELTHFYQTALESVTTDRALIEKLGEPIDADITAEKLFTRQDQGPLNPTTEHIEFEVRGPKGVGKVLAISKPGRSDGVPPGGGDGIQPDKIQVTLQDGSTVEVRPLRRPLPPVR